MILPSTGYIHIHIHRMLVDQLTQCLYEWGAFQQRLSTNCEITGGARVISPGTSAVRVHVAL